MSKFKSTNREEFICISYYDTEDLPIDRHCIKYRNIKYDIQEVLERTDNIDYVISDSKTTRNLLKENERLHSIIKEVREYIEKELKSGRSKDNQWLMGCYDEDKHILEILDKDGGKNEPNK